MNHTVHDGFTLIEVAIVLVIVGLLLAGIIKGQELINSATAKSLATDFRNIPLYLYGYQDKFKALPGDDPRADMHVNGTLATPAELRGNGVIDGAWNSASPTAESVLFWQHVRLAGLAPGPTNAADPNYLPRNMGGGLIGIQSNTGFATITGPTAMTGTYVICSDGVLGKFAKQLDKLLDDGETSTGSMRAILSGTTGNAVTSANIDDALSYTVCMGI